MLGIKKILTIFEQVYFVPKRIYNSPKKSGNPGPQKRRACKNRLKEKNALSHILRSKITFARSRKGNFRHIDTKTIPDQVYM